MSTTPATYELAIDAIVKVMFPAMISIFVIVGVFGVVQSLITDPSEAIFFVFWFGALFFMGFQVLSIPLYIDDDGNGTITFRSPARSRKVRVSTIVSIEPVTNLLGFLRLKHESGSIVLLNQFTGFHRLVAALIVANPRIKVRGC